MIEIWKDIEGYNGQYQVSNLGRVFARETYLKSFGRIYQKVPHILKDCSNGRGYRYVTISVNRKRKNYYVHILVAQLFIPNPENKLEVNHINGDKKDNRLENLEWATRKENMQHAKDNGLCKSGSENGAAKKVYDLYKGLVFGCAKEVAKLHNAQYGALKQGLRTNKVYWGYSYHNPFSS